MKQIVLIVVFVFLFVAAALAQGTDQNKVKIEPLREDSTVMHKIIPAEIPKPILDSLLRRNYQIGDVFTAHRNGTNTVYVVEIAHDLVRETFWFNPKGVMLRPSARKIH